MALPPSVPLNQVSRIASACSFSSRIVSGRPFINTSTSGLPVAFRARISSRWFSGMFRSVRLDDSWDMPRDSPTAATTTSASLAAFTASSISTFAGRGSSTTSGASKLRKFR
ncbi:hypothetical protein D3C80_920500 [compost metagenome]